MKKIFVKILTVQYESRKTLISLFSFCIFLFFIVINQSSFGQDINYIQNSGKYYWGQGYSDNDRVADKLAIDNFILELTKELKHKFMSVKREDNISLNEYTKTILNTYAGASFKETNVVVDRAPQSIRTIRYIEKENLSSLFNFRKNKVLDYYNTALKAEEENRISDALQKYYWALLLLETHPDNQTISVKLDERDVNLIDLLPSKINQLFQNLTFTAKEISADSTNSSRLITLYILHNNMPVQNLHYKVWKGNSWSNLIGCKNGTGGIELNENLLRADSVQLQVEYNYESDARIDNALSEVFENLRIPVFDEALFYVDLNLPDTTPQNETDQLDQSMELININAKSENYPPIDSVIYSIITSIDKNNINAVKPYFTKEGWKDFNHMINYGNAKLISRDLNLEARKINNYYVVRKVPMYFKFNTNNREFVEDLVFYLDGRLKVTGLSFSLSDIAINDIINKKEQWGSMHDKYQLISFIENYKTAYCFKRLDYIEKIFDDNAIIIVGKSLKESNSKENRNVVQLYDNDQVEYIRKSKASYLKSLAMVFRSNEYINIHFEDNIVKRTAKEDKIYGIQIAQYYTSQNYSDKGYLFLMIDLNDSLNPLIYVRTWQPRKNPDGSIIGLEDFSF